MHNQNLVNMPKMFIVTFKGPKPFLHSRVTHSLNLLELLVGIINKKKKFQPHRRRKVNVKILACVKHANKNFPSKYSFFSLMLFLSVTTAITYIFKHVSL